MRIVYLGTPEMAVPPLQALHAAGHEILLVVTRVDKKRGRGSALSPSPVKAAALELDIAVSHEPDDVLGAVADGAELALGCNEQRSTTTKNCKVVKLEGFQKGEHQGCTLTRPAGG